MENENLARNAEEMQTASGIPEEEPEEEVGGMSNEGKKSASPDKN